MDGVKAHELEQVLLGKTIENWTVGKYVNHGKSAAVFRAKRGTRTYALKVFDDELIEKYGDAAQLARINRELTLIGKRHPNMVAIRGGGQDPITGNHYLVMDFLNGPNLKDCLSNVPTGNIGLLIKQLASASKFLESLNLVHRDIKPENIIILKDYSKLMLLDFGVLRPIGEPGITDDDGIQSFVDTLQYSSPEFLLRTEEDTVEGWRALTFYQIGGVLHDLIMRSALFADQRQPYARLVNAVQQLTPQIQNAAVPSYLVETARAALAKDPKVRLQLLDWRSFEPPTVGANPAAAARERVSGRSTLASAATAKPAPAGIGAAEVIEAVVNAIKVQVRAIRAANSSSLPAMNVTRAGQQLVRVVLLKSASMQLPIGVVLDLQIEVLDPEVSAIQMYASARTGMSSDGQTGGTVCVFTGLFTADAVSLALEGCIYLSVDQAQQAGGTADIPIDLSALAAKGD